MDVTLPALLKLIGSGPFRIFAFVPQSDTPVRVLLTPEQRLTFLPMSGDVKTAVEGQSAFALPSAVGQGLVEVPPQPGGLIFGEDALNADLSKHERQALGRLALMPSHQLGAMLSMLVAASPAVKSGALSTEDALTRLGFRADAHEESKVQAMAHAPST